MKKIKLALILSVLVGALNSCTAVALGAGAVAGGYTCKKTNICKDLIIKIFKVHSQIQNHQV